MNVNYGIQIDLKELSGLEIDLFICAYNHEVRSLSLYKKLEHKNISERAFALCYKQEKIEELKVKGIQKKLLLNTNEIYSFLDKQFHEIKKDDINIVIDYSCMTKSWYYSIVLYLKNRNIPLNKVNAYFSYTPSKFDEPKPPKPNKEIGPLPGKYIIPTDKPKALIVCLGYEQNKAEGIIEHLDPKISYLFYTNPASDKNFVKTLEKNNKNLLTERTENVIKYPYNNLLYLEKELTVLYYELRRDYSIVIAPLGPKPFTFVSIMMSIKYDDIDIWRVGSGNDINEYKNKPCDEKSFIICKIEFTKDSKNID